MIKKASNSNRGTMQCTYNNFTKTVELAKPKELPTTMTMEKYEILHVKLGISQENNYHKCIFRLIVINWLLTLLIYLYICLKIVF